MNARFQGSICLLLGLLGLAGYLVADLGGGPVRSFPAGVGETDDPVIVPLCPDTWQTTYWGESVESRPSGDLRVAWTVTTYGLRRQPSGERTVLIHAEGQPISGKRWLSDPTDKISRLFVLNRDSSGYLHPVQIPSDGNLLHLPFDLLVPSVGRLASTNESELDLPAIGLAGAWAPRLEAVYEESAADVQHYDVVGESTEVILAGGSRRVRIAASRTTGRIKSLQSVGRWRNQEEDLRTSLQLDFGHTTEMSRDRVADLEHDLALWSDQTAMMNALTLSVSEGRADDSAAVAQRLTKNLARLPLVAELCRDPMIERAITREWKAPAVLLHRIEAGYRCLNRLVAKDQCAWETTDLDGCWRSSYDSRGKIQVLGFVYRGKTETIRAIETLCRIRNQFSTEDVEVIAMSTDIKPEDKQAIRESLLGRLPIYDGRPVGEQFDLWTCGVPIVLVIDRAGKPRVLHACQTIEAGSQVVAQVAKLVEEPSQSDQVDRTTFASRTIDGFDQLNAHATLLSVD
jgi:hypothetical protein